MKKTIRKITTDSLTNSTPNKNYIVQVMRVWHVEGDIRTHSRTKTYRPGQASWQRIQRSLLATRLEAVHQTTECWLSR